MPRIARAKSDEAIYHIMCRSISEFNLFRDDEDKNHYLDVLKKYCGKFHCAVLAYCLMDTHMHLHLNLSEKPDFIRLFGVFTEIFTFSAFSGQKEGYHPYIASINFLTPTILIALRIL